MDKLREKGSFEADQRFVENYCPDIVKGMEKLCQWVNWWKNYTK